jgi:dGTPase
MAKHESRYDHPKLDARFGAGQATVEGQIADLADSIAYNSHDLDDALFFGLVKEKDLTGVKLFQQLSDTFSGMYPEANKYVRRTRCAKLIIDILAKDTVEASAKCLAKLNPQSPQAIRDHSEKVVNLSQNIGAMLEQLSAFLYANVYMHPDVSKALDIARQQLTLLFGIFLDDPMKLPKRYYNRLEDQGLHQVICDYLAGMTDRYCQNLYHEYKG